MQIFISYSRKDQDFAKKLAGWLRKGNYDVWIDLEDIGYGASWNSEIQAGLDDSDMMILLVSESSLESRHVSDEWLYFIDQDKPIIPLLLQQVENMPYQVRAMQWIDFSNPDEFKRRLRELRNELQRQTRQLTNPAGTSKVKVAPSATRWGGKSSTGLYVAGLASVLILLAMVAGVIWYLQRDEPLPLATLPEGAIGILQFIRNDGNAVLDIPPDTRIAELDDRTELDDNAELFSFGSVLRGILQADAVVGINPDSLMTFSQISQPSDPLRLEITRGDIFVDTGNFPGVTIIAPDGLQVEVIGSHVRVRTVPSLTVGCYSGRCRLSGDDGFSLDIPVGTEFVLLEGVTTLEGGLGFLRQILPPDYGAMNDLCGGCLDDVPIPDAVVDELQLTEPTPTITLVPSDTPTATLTATATATMTATTTSTATASPTMTATPTTTHTPSATPSQTPTATLVATNTATTPPTLTPTTAPPTQPAVPTPVPVNYSGTWTTTFAAPENLIPNPPAECATAQSIIDTYLFTLNQFNGSTVLLTLTDTGNSISINGLDTLVQGLTLTRTAPNLYSADTALLTLPNIVTVRLRMALTFNSANNMTLAIQITDGGAGCAAITLTGSGVRSS